MGIRVFLDSETTGVDPEVARLVELALIEPATGNRWSSLINPGIPIPPDATEVHGITDADVADAPAFVDVAPMVQATLTAPADDPPVLVSFNGRRYDTVLIDAELRRAGQPGLPRDATGRMTVPEIDLYRVWVEVERRNLEAAVERFAGRELDDAHRAEADAAALIDVLAGMGEEFGLDVDDDETMISASVPEGEVDRAGRFRKEDGRVLFNFGKHRDKDVRQHLDYLEWMVGPGRDFPAETQAVTRWLLARYGGQ